MNEARKHKILENVKKFKIKNFILLTLAGIINTFGVTVFLNPVKLYDRGISGTSMLLAQITPEYLTLSIFLLLLNIPLLPMVRHLKPLTLLLKVLTVQNAL